MVRARLTKLLSRLRPVALESSTDAAVRRSMSLALTPRLTASAWLEMMASSLNLVVASSAAACSCSFSDTSAAAGPSPESAWSSRLTTASCSPAAVTNETIPLVMPLKSCTTSPSVMTNLDDRKLPSREKAPCVRLTPALALSSSSRTTRCLKSPLAT